LVLEQFNRAAPNLVNSGSITCEYKQLRQMSTGCPTLVSN
jgi:hypothetical protein